MADTNESWTMTNALRWRRCAVEDFVDSAAVVSGFVLEQLWSSDKGDVRWTRVPLV